MSINNFYLSRYTKFITWYKTKFTYISGYYEKHHIIPKCMGGTDDAENIVLLPSRAHFIAHALLHKAYPEHTGLAHAFAMMAVNNHNQHRSFSSRLYALSKVARSNALKGVSRPDWVKEKLRKPKSNRDNYSKPKSEEHKRKIGLAHKGKKKSPEAVHKCQKSKEKYFEEMKIATANKTVILRKEFTASKLSRMEFAKQQNIPYNTIKKFLRGL